MGKKHLKLVLILSIFSLFSLTKAFSLNFTDINSTLADIFFWATDDNEGATAFRSLLIPYGGRSESLGSAYTGLSDDVSYLQFNPSAGSLQKETQFSVFHNAWIADSKLDSIAYTTRFNNFSLGGFFQCFYVPFTEYNLFGDRVASSYYSESVVGINTSYNFLAGYDFKGIALGATVKAGWRQMPNYTNNDTNEIISFSGLEQSSLAIMADFGAMVQFNFLKFYASRDPNVRIGIAAQNVGAAITGLFSDSGLKVDDGLPTYFAAGISLKPLKPILITADIKQPVNFFNITNYLLPYFSLGVSIQFTKMLAVLAGFELKGGNPKISAGFEFEFSKIRLNFNYSLDLTTSFTTYNKISLSAKLLLGDRGRSIVDAKVDELYKLGLIYYADARWEDAIDTWQQCLKLNKRFDPAILGIQSAQAIIYTLQTAEEFKRLN